jgi:hypothetical protein
MMEGMKPPRFDRDEVKRAAAGRWPDILASVGALPAELLDTSREHPCPRCGGATRFRVFADDSGGAHCSHCFKEKNGDGLATIRWLLDCSFPDALTLVGEHLGLSPRNGNRYHVDPLEALARDKHCPADGLQAYGARIDGRAVIMPMFDGSGAQCSEFKMQAGKGKGLSAKGKPVGVFLPVVDGNPRLPQPGETWVVCEGVKECAAWQAMGFLALGLPGKNLSRKWARLLRGVDVRVALDRDTAGDEGAQAIGAKLHGVAAMVRIVALPIDWQPKDGPGVREALAQRDGEQLVRQAVEDAAPWQGKGSDPDHNPLGNITNATTKTGDDGEEHVVPLSMSAVIGSIYHATGDWPRRVENVLFCHDSHGVCWLQSPSALFGWLGREVGVIHWSKSAGCVTKEEVYAELRRTARRYDAVEELPHEPKLETHYYACQDPKPGNGAALREFLDRFNPETPIDRDLIQAALMTCFWGGPGGLRPCFVVTSNDGCGAGKSTIPNMIGRVVGGIIAFDRGEDVAAIKTRLLSPAAITKRVALLDNVKSLRFSWGELEGLITSPTISGRQMYVGEGNRPNGISWFITLNGASLSTDMSQRAVVIKVAKPSRSGAWEEDTFRFIDAHQSALVGDVVAALRAETYPLTKFTRWAMWERSVLARLPEPTEAQSIIIERQGQVDAEQEENELIQDYFAERLEGLGYDAQEDRILIPSGVAARWFNEVNSSRDSTTAVSRCLKRLINEQRIRNLSEAKGRTHGRGFVWSTLQAVTSNLCIDLQQRIEEQRRQQS